MGKKKRRKQVEAEGDGGAVPYWSPLERPKFTRWQQACIVARNLVPLACLAVFHGSIAQFMLLSVFNLAFTIAGIGTIGVGVSTRQEVKSTGMADQVGSLLTLAAICIVASLVLTALFGWIFALWAGEESEGLWNATLWWGVLGTVLASLPGMVMQYYEDLRLNLSEDQRKRRDQPVVGVHLFSAVFIVILAGWTLEWGRVGAVLLALLVTAMFIFRDLRPDLARALAR